MKRFIFTAAALACLLVPASAFADGSTTQAAPTTAPTTTASTDTSTSTSTPAATTTTPPATTTTTTPPTTTTTTTTPTTTTTTPTCVVTTCTGTGTSIDLPKNDPCVDDVAACDSPQVGGEGVGPSHPVYGAGRSLPFTGIEDTLLPIVVGLVALLGGIIAYRYATVRERLGRVMRVAQERANRRTVTGYTWAMQNLDADCRTASFWTGRPPRAA